jgi:PAS domain-containing protein
MAPKILFVDDEGKVLSAYTRVLRKRFQVDTAPNGAEALGRIRDEGPCAVVISDMRMPGMDDLVYVVDPEGRLILANWGLATLLGTTPEVMIGQPRETWLPADIETARRAGDQQVLESGETCILEERNQESNDKPIYRSAKYPVRYASSQTEGRGGVSTDLSMVPATEAKTEAPLRNLGTVLEAQNFVEVGHE